MCRRIQMRCEKNSTRVSNNQCTNHPISENMSSLIFLLTIRFDGDFLDSNKTAEEQDLEGGELIDMFVSN